jgi:regulator of cell morphogenesis and NO signaling
MKDMTIGEIVASDFRAASIFREAGIDFCCGGKQTVDLICLEKEIDKTELLSRLEELKSVPDTSNHNFITWDPTFLCDYIVNTHHKYVLKSLPDLVFYTQKIADVHGKNHSELLTVAELFSRINKELLQHLKNEEEVLFPAIKKVFSSEPGNAGAIINSEILRLSGEHEFAGGAMDKINVITSGYTVPPDGCNTYNVTFKLLKEFEDDLHIHVHLENNILFPKALTTSN